MKNVDEPQAARDRDHSCCSIAGIKASPRRTLFNIAWDLLATKRCMNLCPSCSGPICRQSTRHRTVASPKRKPFRNCARRADPTGCPARSLISARALGPVQDSCKVHQVHYVHRTRPRSDYAPEVGSPDGFRISAFLGVLQRGHFWWWWSKPQPVHGLYSSAASSKVSNLSPS